MIIGICGKSGSGKSTIAKEIIGAYQNEGVHLDIDKVGHKVLTINKAKEELINFFGRDIITENNIDRKKLGQIVFNSEEKMNRLSDITWKYMQIEIDKFIEDNNNKLIILDWLLLPKTKYFNMCDFKILLDIPYEIRKLRAIKRDNISPESFDLRDNASIEYNNEDFDYVMKENNEEEIRRWVRSL